MEKIKIESDFIKLDQFLKFAGVVQTGGQAKILISQEDVLVNNEICTKRGKKLRIDNIIEIKGYGSFVVI